MLDSMSNIHWQDVSSTPSVTVLAMPVGTWSVTTLVIGLPFAVETAVRRGRAGGKHARDIRSLSYVCVVIWGGEHTGVDHGPSDASVACRM